jgi:hypothetical protein
MLAHQSMVFARRSDFPTGNGGVSGIPNSKWMSVASFVVSMVSSVALLHVYVEGMYDLLLICSHKPT